MGTGKVEDERKVGETDILHIILTFVSAIHIHAYTIYIYKGHLLFRHPGSDVQLMSVWSTVVVVGRCQGGAGGKLYILYKGEM